jgi:hypothetical protein
LFDGLMGHMRMFLGLLFWRAQKSCLP